MIQALENFTTKELVCNIAGILYRIEYQSDTIPRRFEDYIVSDQELNNSDLVHIKCSESDLDKTRSENTEDYPDSYIEYLTIMTKIVSDLPNHEMLLMHGATIEYQNQAFIFTAPSGTGKSTHISLWKKYLGDNVEIINGDKPEISFEGNNVFAHGAPWCGKEGWNVNKKSKLKGICVINRSDNNRISELDPKEIVDVFLSQLFVFDENKILDVLDMFIKITENVPFYLLECDMSEEAAKCSFEKLTGCDWEQSKKVSV